MWCDCKYLVINKISIWGPQSPKNGKQMSACKYVVVVWTQGYAKSTEPI